MIEVSRLPIIYYLKLFVAYVVTHSLIGIFLKHIKYKHNKEINSNKRDELTEVIRITGILFKWYPVFYVLLLLLILGV